KIITPIYDILKRQTPMISQLTILIFLLTISITSCGQANTSKENPNKQTGKIELDSSIIAIFPFNTTQHWIFRNNKQVDLTSDDLQKIETILTECLNDYNAEQEGKFREINDKHPEHKLNKKNFVIDLKRYKRQYVATENSKGEKEVWINCFCDTWGKNWKTNLVFVKDGGNCYFNLKINLTTGESYEFMVNGDA
ncbi:hypothetical protein LJC68_10350, partial [Bacteroidales bacterium OttesenSCG-928-B11]|nr:hypothetical protein [Bacteroidales bacterium OttesenSCG-928-B11]